MSLITGTLTLVDSAVKTAEAFIDQLIARGYHVKSSDPDDVKLFNSIAQNIADIGTKLQRIAPQ